MSDLTPVEGQPDAGDAGRRYPEDASPFQATKRASLLRRTFPVSANLGDYPKRNARRDVVAGLTIAALALPSGMAYAELAGLSPVVGLYALLLPAVAYTLLGSSRQLIVGPEGALALLIATAIAPIADGDPEAYTSLAAMLAVLVGLIAVVARLVRLGWIADYFSRAVLIGYLHGIVVVLVTGQLGKLFGLSISESDPIPQLREFIDEVTDAHALTVLVGAVSLAAVLLLRWLAPRAPGPLIVVLGGIASSAAFELADHGVAIVGHIPPGLPSLHWPSVGLGDVGQLAPAAFGIFAVAYADGILTARAFAGRNGQHVDANQEMLALGAANFAAGVTQAFPVGASGSRTAVNDQIGGRTQLVGLVGAGVIAVVLLFLTAPVEKLPSACLGAVIVAAAIGIVEPGAWRALARAGRGQVSIAIVTLVGVVVVGVLQALLVAVLLSLIEVATRSAHPHDAVLGYVERLGRWANVALHPSARVKPGVVVYRMDDRLLFANVRYFKGRIQEALAGAPTAARWLVFDAEGLTGIDAAGVEAIEQVVASLRRDGVTFVVARLKSPVERDFYSTNLVHAIGTANFFPTVQAAVDACDRSAGPT